MTRKSVRRHRSLAAGMEQLEERRVFATRVWDGGSPTNDFWNNRFNWEGNTAPVAGDSLRFPNSIRFTDRGLVNNFPNGTQFENIFLEGEAYLLRGNKIQLNGDFIYAPKDQQTIKNSKINFNIEFGSGDHKIQVIPFKATDNEELQFNGQLSDNGSGNIFVSGFADILIGGDAVNTINTHTIIVDNPGVNGGLFTDVILDKPDNVRAIFGDLVVGNLAGVRTEIRIPGLSTNIEKKIGQINPNSAVTVRDRGELDIAIETIQDLTLATEGEVIIQQRFDDSSNDADSIQGALTLGGTVNVTSGEAAIRRQGNDNNPRVKLGQETTVNVAQGAVLNLSVATSGGDLIKEGRGRLKLIPVNANNQHDDTVVTEGTLDLGGPGAGRITIPDDLFVEAGGQVTHARFSNQIADAADVTINGGIFVIANGIEDEIAKLTVEDGGNLFVRDADTELLVTGNSTVNIGEIDVLLQGTLIFQEKLTVIRSPVTTNQATLRVDEVVLSRGELTSIGADAEMELQGNIQVLAEVVESKINGRLFLRPGDHTFDVANGTVVNDLVVNAILDDRSGTFGAPAGIKKIGPGRMLLAANNAYVGDTKLETGVLVINGVQTNNQVFATGGFLAGAGDARKLIQDGGTLNPGVNVGILKATDFAFIGGAAKFKAQINGGTVGTQFDQLRTNVLQLGTNHPTLEIALNFTPAIGQRFKLINVFGTGVLAADQFFKDLDGTPLPEGSAFKINGLDFTITYKGTGNDVILTRNAPPAFVNRAITPEVNEGERVFVTGTITEPDPNNTFFLDVDWADGSPLQTFTFPPGSNPNISVSHKYLDDRRTTNDTYNVKLKWRDEFGGTNGAVLSTIVHNVSPEILALTASLPPINANVPFTLQGSFTDSTKDSFKVYIQWEANAAFESFDLAAGEDSFSVTHTYATTGQKNVTVLLIDDDLGIDQQELTIEVV